MRNLKLYPDELFYSYLARYRVRLNLLSYEDFSRYMYVYPEVRPECLFTNTLRPKIFEEITAGLAWKDVIDNHTMIPEYRFEKKEKFEHGYQILLERGSRNYQYITDKHIEDRTLRYCPACALEERKKYGEAYWHRLPQIRGMKTCPEHHCYLMDSSVTLSRHCVANIYPAELVIPEDAAPVKCTNEKEAELANYYKEVFEAPININAPIPVGRFLGMSLSDKYRVGRSKKYMYRDSAVKDITAIQRDLSVFLEEREQRSMDASVLGKIYVGNRTTFSDICNIACFERISAETLTMPEQWTEMIPYDHIFAEVAHALNMDYEIVSKIGKKVLQSYLNEGRIQKKTGMQELEWDKLDRETLPKVKELCEQIYGIGSERPHRVTMGSIYKALSLPQRRLERMPLCKREIQKYKESPTEYWARETVWAYKTILESETIMTKTRIQNLTQTKNRDYERFKPFLHKYADTDTVDKIIELMEG